MAIDVRELRAQPLDPEIETELERFEDGVQRYLAGLGMWDAKREAEWSEELRQENEKALTHAAGAAAPRPEDVFANVYKDPPPRVLRQRAELVDGSGS